MSSYYDEQYSNPCMNMSLPQVAPPVMDPDKVKVEVRRDGLRIYIPDDDSDSLVVIDIKRNYNTLWAKLGLRGNFSMARNRGMRYVSTSMDAPDVSEEERERRKQACLARNGYAVKTPW